MLVTPDYDRFAAAYERGESQIISTRLVADLETPVSAMLKLARNARYSFPLGSSKGHVQAVVSHQSSASSDIRTAATQTGTGNTYSPAAQLGDLKAYTTASFSFGAEFGMFSVEAFIDNAFDERGQISRFAQCGACLRTYIVPITPRTIGLRVGSKF